MPRGRNTTRNQAALGSDQPLHVQFQKDFAAGLQGIANPVPLGLQGLNGMDRASALGLNLP